jgi:putative Mn2+ efflux pump MntP
LHTQLLLVAAVAVIGVLHTIVPDHWAPIAVVARQQRWTRRQTAWTAAGAGLGHTVSTLAIGAVAWLVGVAAAQRYGHYVNIASGIALIAFGLWIAIGALREAREPESEIESEVTAEAKKIAMRTSVILVLGSSPSVEALPTFFAAAKYGVYWELVLAAVFAATTIGTYVVTCVLSAAGLEKLRLTPLERYGEVISGGFVAIVGAIFLFL